MDNNLRKQLKIMENALRRNGKETMAEAIEEAILQLELGEKEYDKFKTKVKELAQRWKEYGRGGDRPAAVHSKQLFKLLK